MRDKNFDIKKVYYIAWVATLLYLAVFSKAGANVKLAVYALFLIVTSALETKAKPAVKALLFFAGGSSLVYYIFRFHHVVKNSGYLAGADKAAAVLIVSAVLFAGMTAARPVSILALVFITYPFAGHLLFDPLACGTFSVRRVLSHLVWGSQGIFGIGLNVGLTYIFPFVVFGAVLKASGFSDYINAIALKLLGDSPGGPAKVAVAASSVLGMINGSAVANVATTGPITIPVMKRAGYSSEFAAAVEAASSTGGQFLPPIMGAVAFVMAEFLSVSYRTVMLAASVPALLYYTALMLSVHIEAKLNGLKGEDTGDETLAETVLSGAHLLIPLISLTALLIAGFTPVFAGIASIAACIAASYLKPSTRMSLKEISDALAEGAAASLKVGISCAVIGIIIGIVSLTGIGLNIGAFIVNSAGTSSIYAAALMVAVMSVILGMGVPGVAAYVIAASVSIPVLIKSGANPIAAHLFCLIYACLSNITPPVAISSYIAASIAGADEFKTSLKAVKIGAVGFITPFFFINDTALLPGVGKFSFSVLLSILTAFIGVFGLSFGLGGYCMGKLGAVMRILFAASALMLISPDRLTDATGITLMTALIFYCWRKNK